MLLFRQTRVRLALGALALGALVLLAGACRNDGGVGPNAGTIDASYRLVSADERPLPTTVFAALGGFDEVLGARLSLARDRSASIVFERRATTGGQPGPVTRDSADATYALSGTRLILTFAVPGTQRTRADTGMIDNTLGPAALLSIRMKINGRAGNSTAALSFIRDDAGPQR